ncbi:ubiquitin-protein ligase E3A [Chironomus tepperi]|uniref:ubiquitin-protein ligase E3A n=1 Tax=Chironomus tepperi TaxID=113505 RepID=UPI00391FB1ED
MDSNVRNSKQTQAKKLIEKYFFQITVGCGNADCKNKYCLSSGHLEKSLTPNQAAVKAIQLYVEEAKLCENLKGTEELQKNNSPSSEDIEMEGPFNKKTNTESDFMKKVEPSHSSLNRKSNDNLSPSSPTKELSYIDEAKLDEMIENCVETNNFAPIIRSLGRVFSDKDSVLKSFQLKPKSSIDVILDRVQQVSAIKTMKKEDIRTLEDDEKDQDLMDCEENKDEKVPPYSTIDFESLRRSFRKLYEKNSKVFEALDNAIQSLATLIQIDMRIMRENEQFEEVLCCIVILFEIFQIGSSMLEQSIFRTLTAITELPIWAQAKLAQIWSTHCKEGLRPILLILQQIITLQVISNTYHRNFHVNDNEIVANATKVMKIVFCANILASEMIELPKYLPEQSKASGNEESMHEEEDEDDFSSILYQVDSSKNKQIFEDPLMKELGFSVHDCNEPFIPYEEFQNEPLCDVIETDEDYMRYRNLVFNDNNSMPFSSNKKFSFIVYSFILTPSAKTLKLFFDSRFKMYTERMLLNPYLKLKIRRDFIIDDALAELEMVALSNPKDLKKQIFIEFDGEQGIDEGGVSKEFFQLIVEEIFNPDYGMFTTNEDTQTCWFNSFSFENEAQFTLIGIVLGLAIYNSIILPLNFPMVVYKKLMDVRSSWHDLKDWNPILYNSLKAILDYTEPDMEEVFSQTFEIGYENVFGAPIKHCLKSDGENIPVNQNNKHEFVELYANFVLNQSIEKQFKAFKKGFQMVTDESPLKLLFRPEEIELLVCGSKNFDFDELEKSTEYEGGYTAETEIIKHFWSVVHGLSLENKRKLLQFTTGSNRVPVGGLSKLKLVIARHGPDCDRLPTSHTCFNILLLPEYSSREKIEERLLKAINYSKGFGML